MELGVNVYMNENTDYIYIYIYREFIPQKPFVNILAETMNQ